MEKSDYKVIESTSSDGSTIYSFVDKSGDSQLKVYDLMTRITLTHHSAHTNRFYSYTKKGESLIEIYHCREGRMECSYKDGYFYLMPGDLAIGIIENCENEYIFPLNHYHGITITINTAIAPKCFSCFLEDVNVQPIKVASKLCNGNSFFVIRSRSYIEHLFSEMYKVPCDSTKGYYKIKVLELLFILSGVDPKENRLNTYTLSSSQVSLAKRAAEFIAANRDEQITVSMLSKRFNVSITHLQNAFKGVFGVTV